MAAGEKPKILKQIKTPASVGLVRKQKKKDLIVVRKEDYNALKDQAKQLAKDKEKKDAAKRLYALKIDPFPPSLPIVEKFGAWLEYAEKLKKQLKPCRAAGQDLLATVVYGAIGQELVEIVNMKQLFPDESEVAGSYGFLDEMLGGLEKYLRSLSDDSMNMNHLLNMRQ